MKRNKHLIYENGRCVGLSLYAVERFADAMRQNGMYPQIVEKSVPGAYVLRTEGIMDWELFCLLTGYVAGQLRIPLAGAKGVAA